MDKVIVEDRAPEPSLSVEDFLRQMQQRYSERSIEQIAHAMTEDGFAPGYARALAAAARIRYGDDVYGIARNGPLRDAIEAMAAAAREPMVRTSEELQPRGLCEPTELRTNSVNVAGQIIALRLTSRSPRLALFGNFASPQECEAMIELAKARRQPSGCITEYGDVDEEDVRQRPSHGSYYDFLHPFEGVIDTLTRRAAELLGWPPAWIGPLKILHYPAGVRSRPQLDWYDPSTAAGRDQAQRKGQVVATFLLYLNEVRSGGSTSFLARGLRVHPRRGDAAYFISQRDDGRFDSANLHRAEPVGDGEKWLATFWCRDLPGAA